MADEQSKTEPSEERRVMERREFLRKCGKYAAVVPPSMVLLLSTTRGAEAFHGGPHGPGIPGPPENPGPPFVPPGFSFAPPGGPGRGPF